MAEHKTEFDQIRVGFRYRDGEVLAPEREALSEDIELPEAVIDLGDGEWLTLAELRDMHAERLELAATCGLDEGYGVCGLRAGHDPGLHAVPIGGGSDPIDDPEVWFVFGSDVEKPEYRSLRLEARDA